MARRTSAFLREFVVLFGFLNGVWLAVGVNPGAKLLEVLAGILLNLTGREGTLQLVLTLLPVILTVVTLFLILRKGGFVGLLAVIVALVGGMQILADPTVSLVLLLAAMGLGYFATK